MVENFGLHLKHERELRGVSLEEIAESTRIHIRYLEALESNEFDDMPGEVFVKGYIRSYARVIGSDSEEMVNVYDEAVGKDRKIELDKVAGSNEKDSPGNKKAAGYILFGLALIALITFGYSVVGGIVDKNKKQQAKLVPQGETPAKEEAPKVPAETSPPEKAEIDISEKQTEEPPQENLQNASSSASVSTEPLKESTEENSTAPVPTDSPSETTREADNPTESETVKKEENEPQAQVIAVNPLLSQEDKKEAPKTPIESAVIEKNPHSTEKPVIIQQVMENSAEPVLSGQNLSESDGKPLHLKIKVQGNSWFNVTVDDSKVEDFILPGGSSKNVYGREKIQLTIGNRNGTELFLNEQPIDLPPGSNDVIRNFDITANLLE